MARIFIVEDNDIHLKTLESKVKLLGYQIAGTAKRAIDALSKIKKTDLDVILLDINLNGDNDGIPLANQIKEFSNIPIIYVTSLTSNEIIKTAIASDPSGFLVKPVDNHELKANIQLALHKNNPIFTHVSNSKKLENEYITIRTGNKLQKIHFNSIWYLKVASKNYVTLVDENCKEFVLRGSLKNIINNDLPNFFMRVHHSYGANIYQIEHVDEKEQFLYMKNRQYIPIGKSFKHDLYMKLNIK